MTRAGAFLLLLGCTPPAVAQSGRIGIIDFFDARTVAVADFRRALGVTEGDSLATPAAELVRRLEAEALPALSKMGRWKAPGHAFAAFERGDRETVVAAAGR